MNSTTLRGIFPDPKPIHRRNFVRENIRHLKEMQGFIQKQVQTQSSSQFIKSNKLKHGLKTYSFDKKRSREDKLPSNDQLKRNFPPTMQFYSTTNNAPPSQKLTHRGVQTERPEDISKLYETGTLIFPSPSIVPPSNNSKQISPARAQDQGDIAEDMEKLDLNEKTNHIKRNIKNLKTKVKLDEVPDPTVPPPNYKKGVVPKYLKDKEKPKEEAKVNISKATEYEGEQISGLVLLPDDERKEYLRVARENYASLIKELNSMPVSNDTLKRRKRKMEIEEELKRLDEVIKIFQKPKVFVKADA